MGVSSAHALTLEKVGDYVDPVYVTSPPGDPDTVLVVEKHGVIQTTSGEPFLDLQSEVLTDEEAGLLSMAFAPDYSDTGLLYVLYVEEGSEDIRIDEFQVTEEGVDPASRRQVMTIAHPWSHFHYSGQLQFGPDGYLYVSVGDGNKPADPEENAQDLDSLHGKILRIDPQPDGSETYGVPEDNPFVDQPGADEVWSYGLRNPWRFSFDSATGALVLPDVGHATWEEINYAPQAAGGGKGANFGWDCREGTDEFEPDPMGCSGPFTDPVFQYGHDAEHCAIVGGYVAHDPQMPTLEGRYVYGDYCAGEIRSVQLGAGAASDDRLEGGVVEGMSSFGQDGAGRLYVVAYGPFTQPDGAVYRLVESAPGAVAGPPLDSSPPNLLLEGGDRQRADRRLTVTATVDEAAVVEIGAEVVIGKRRRELFALEGKSLHPEPGVAERVDLELGRDGARRCRRLIAEGRRLKVRFHGAVTDSAGNHGKGAQHTARLRVG
jgi:glucose/arabinose dehydrogenase